MNETIETDSGAHGGAGSSDVIPSRLWSCTLCDDKFTTWVEVEAHLRKYPQLKEGYKIKRVANDQL